jgi:hypothetical protein
MNEDLPGAKQKRFNGGFLLLLLLLGGTLAVLCHQGFRPYEVFWANDLPLGALVNSSARLPASFFGCWADFYWLGGPSAAFPPNLTNISLAIFTPEHQFKFYPPGSMFFLGLGAWFFFRQLRLSTMACILGGLGAGLNMHFFSNACWGLGQWNVCCGMIFIALGVVVSPAIKQLWIKAVLAGLSVGMAVMEGNDVGAIMSLYVAVFVLFRFLSTESNPAKGLGKAVCVGVVLVVSALLISLSTIYTLIGTQLTGTATVGQSEAARRQAWDFNTQWSIPKLETLRMIIPGLFGYRLDVYTTSGSPAAYYWGSIAEDPRIGELESSDPVVRSNAVAALPAPPQVLAQLQSIMAGNDMTARENIIDQVKGMGQRRHTGSGEYTGVLVCLLALFGLANAARKTASPYSTDERRMVWFWGGVALFSLLAAWGRYGFLYALIYHLPLVANFRNPMKYMHPLNISMMILSAYGVEALARQYLTAAAKNAESLFQQIWTSWKRVSAFEIYWAAGCAVVLIGSVGGYFKLASSKPALINYLLHNGFSPTDAPQIASFCIGEVAWFILYLAVSVGLVACILAGGFAGRRALWAWIFLAAIMICDLSRADIPWIRYYNYKEKMSPNPVVDLLKREPWEHRVNSRSWPAGGYMTPELTMACHWWIENDYPFNDIESLEIDQAPRMATLDSDYLGRFYLTSDKDLSPATRLWRLTNTRYLVAGPEWERPLNQLGEPKNSFRTLMRLNLVNKPGIDQPEDPGDQTLQTNGSGPQVCLYEFTAALPRAKLYSNWQVVDDPTALQLLSSAPFDPAKTVLVAKDTPVSQAPGNAETDPGTVKITHYQSTELMMEADAKTPAVLLLNDRTGDSWNVLVDQKPAPFLRCNHIMQGTFVPAGHHTIEFRYQPSLKLLFISLSAFGLGILLAGYVIFTNFKREPEPSPAPESKRPEKPHKPS